MIADDFITFSSRFPTHGVTEGHAREIAIEISRWLYDHDPRGSGIVTDGGLHLTFSDGSSCFIDVLTCQVTRPQ